ncbi:uncharacterized protein LOC131252826 isoform X1 [Magnolia sinica]|uniref:uncharacterized protein LOC131252826 isoform X1 n=1 Tax=Magnolia sinica TaxID=86752 RepID=UPI002657D2EA|nr:uncharacterized protein LOC131252826 isoform X1 [Magnolia sinica]
MLRFAAKRAVTAALKHPRKPLPTVRSYATDGRDADSVSLQMINYALNLARSQKSGESYAQALLVLEQGLSNLRRVDSAHEDGVGMVLLAMSTILAERGEFGDAIEKLQEVVDLERSSLVVKVAAWEGLVGLHLETGQDVTSSVPADECLQLLKNTPKDESSTFKALHLRANAVKGLADLVTGDLTSGNSYFGDNTSFESQETRCCTGNVALSHGEFLHASGKLSAAEEFYQKALKASETKDFSDATVLAAGNMVSEKVSLGASCALGQLLTHLGNFQEAEEILTKALTKAETHFGSCHPNVGVVLTCIAMMFGHKARLERSSSLLIQEGLYRRALDLLKAPSLDTEVTDMHVDKRDIVALARGGYAQTLSVQQYRKEEGERMRKWAESIWRNCRLSLAEALEISEPSKVTVIDARINRVI